MKIMKLITCIVLLSFVACDTAKKEDSASVIVEETVVIVPVGTSSWNQAWNTKDLDALRQMTGDGAVMLAEGEMMNRQQIDTWFQENVGAVKDLQTTPAMSNTGETIAYEGGTYTHKVEGTDQTFDGVYTVVWEKIGEDWKIKLLDLSSKIPESSSAE